jgi:hypothetical protein
MVYCLLSIMHAGCGPPLPKLERGSDVIARFLGVFYEQVETYRCEEII